MHTAEIIARCGCSPRASRSEMEVLGITPEEKLTPSTLPRRVFSASNMDWNVKRTGMFDLHRGNLDTSAAAEWYIEHFKSPYMAAWCKLPGDFKAFNGKGMSTALLETGECDTVYATDDTTCACGFCIDMPMQATSGARL